MHKNNKNFLCVERSKLTIVAVTVFILFFSCPYRAKGGEEKSESRIYNIGRLQYISSFNGEGLFSQTMFVAFPNRFFIAERMEFITPIGKNRLINFENFFFEANTGRPLFPGSEWGRVPGWVARVQALNDEKTTLSLGLQFNISDIPILIESSKRNRWKSFVQVFFIKNIGDAQDFDVYHWYQFPFFWERTEIRGVNAFYSINGEKDFVYLMQDLIYSFARTWDVYLRHSYQNRDGFQHRSDGSQFGIGIRYNFTL